jgi:hypothetical protein
LSQCIADDSRNARTSLRPWIGVLVQVGAVEQTERPLVGGKMRGHPVQDDPESALVEVVHERHELLRRPVAGRRGEVPGRLVAPRAVERMLHQREELDVGEPGALGMLGEAGSQLLV